MKIDRVWAVCDANGEFKGLFSTEEVANKVADHHGAYVTSVDTVHETFGQYWQEIGRSTRPELPVQLVGVIHEELGVFLVEAGPRRVEVIKVIREITGLGIPGAKKLVDELPGLVRSHISQNEANEIAKKLQGAGASVKVCPCFP